MAPIRPPSAVVVASAETLSVVARPSERAQQDADDLTPVVLLLPGPIGSAFGLRHLTDALGDAGTATVVVDLLGMGASSRPKVANYSLSAQAARLAAVLDTLGVRRVLIVAHGVSASIAMRFAADHPGAVSGIVSISGGPIDVQKTNGLHAALTFARLLDNPIGRALGRRKFQGAMRETSASDAWNTSQVMHEYLKPYEKNLRGSLNALQQMSEAVEPLPIASVLPRVLAPVRLLIGEKISGGTPTPEQIALLVRLLPQFRVDTIPRSGTLVHEERPDAVLSAIRALLVRPQVVAPLESRFPVPTAVRHQRFGNSSRYGTRAPKA